MPHDMSAEETFVTVGICADDQKSQYFSMVSSMLYGEFDGLFMEHIITNTFSAL